MKYTSRFARVRLAVTAIMLAVCTCVIGASSAYAYVALELNSATRHEAYATLSESGRAYYTEDGSFEYLASLPGALDASDSYAAMQDNQLYDALQELMQSTLGRTSIPTYGGYGEGSLAFYWNATDTSPELDNSLSSHFLLFYSDAHYEYPSSGTRLYMSREHVWPKSRASFHQMNGGVDLHHLRPTLESVNAAKSDHLFGYVDEVYASGYDVGTIDGVEAYLVYPDKEVFEPKDDVKGDVARILLYVYCCWGQPNLYSDVPASQLPEGDPDEVTNTGGRVITDLDTLLAWCEDDPVDTWEMQRNDLVQQVQGNRNVFIDYPELAWLLFGREIPQGMQTPTQAGCEHSYGDAVTSESGCTQPGTKSETCTICGNVHTVPIPALGHVDEDGDSCCDRCGAGLMGAFTLADEVSDGDHLILFHPGSGKAITPVVNNSNRLKGITAIENDGVIVPDQDTAVFHAVSAEDDGFYLMYAGKYLATARSGNHLYWVDDADDYSVWRFIGAGDGCTYVVSAKAGFEAKPQALEFFNKAFTTYGLSTGNPAFEFMVFTSSSHVWGEPSLTEPDCTHDGERLQTCVSCMEQRITTLPALGHEWGAWEQTKAPTEAEEGEESRICARCGEAESRSVPKLEPQRTYTIAYDPDGGSFRGSTLVTSIVCPDGQTIKIAEAPSRDGYTFLYWRGSKGSEYQPGDSYTVTEDYTFTAVWKKDSGDEPGESGAKDPTGPGAKDPTGPGAKDPTGSEAEDQAGSAAKDPAGPMTRTSATPAAAVIPNAGDDSPLVPLVVFAAAAVDLIAVAVLRRKQF